MPLGDGFFYDRKRRRYIRITEHATDAVTRPDVFSSHKVKHLDPVKDRDTIVIHVLKNGFIRVRHWKDRLGWQFWGDTEDALKTLKRYIKKNGVGDGAVITFTDFKTGKNIECNTRVILEKDFLETF
jgi:hypothetical protein